MLLSRLFRQPETEAGLEEQSQVNTSVPPLAKTSRVRKKKAGQYPSLRAALVAAAINRATEEGSRPSEIEAAPRVDDLAEATELALILYCRAVFASKLAELRLELVTSETNQV